MSLTLEDLEVLSLADYAEVRNLARQLILSVAFCTDDESIRSYVHDFNWRVSCMITASEIQRLFNEHTERLLLEALQQ